MGQSRAVQSGSEQHFRHVLRRLKFGYVVVVSCESVWGPITLDTEHWVLPLEMGYGARSFVAGAPVSAILSEFPPSRCCCQSCRRTHTDLKVHGDLVSFVLPQARYNTPPRVPEQHQRTAPSSTGGSGPLAASRVSVAARRALSRFPSLRGSVDAGHRGDVVSLRVGLPNTP